MKRQSCIVYPCEQSQSLAGCLRSTRRGGHEPYADLCTLDIDNEDTTLCVPELKSGVERGVEAGEGGGISGDILSGWILSSASSSACLPAPAALWMQLDLCCCLGYILPHQLLYLSGTCVRTYGCTKKQVSKLTVGWQISTAQNFDFAHA